MAPRAIGLLSGGLDSSLALSVMQTEGVDTAALSFVTPFCTCNRNGRCEAQVAAERAGVPLQTIALRDEFFDIIRDPKHGYGSGANPCLDCRILMFSRARQEMIRSRADFVFTGEVLGQRPMSQHLTAMRIIDSESRLEGLVLRPLSAKLLPPTIPERQGLVDRNRMLAIRGRSRRPQMDLAVQYGIADYPCPAGGCRLAEPGFARRMLDLVNHKPDFVASDVDLLRVGRHFRLGPQIKAVVGRDERENALIQRLAHGTDLLMEVAGYKGPQTLIRGETDRDTVRLAASLTVRYSDAEDWPVRVEIKEKETTREYIMVSPVDEGRLVRLRI